MTTPKGLSGTISLQMHCGKSGCLTDEADELRTTNVNKGNTYYYYEMHFYVLRRLKNDPFVARIYCIVNGRKLRVAQFKTFYANETAMYGCLMGRSSV